MELYDSVKNSFSEGEQFDKIDSTSQPKRATHFNVIRDRNLGTLLLMPSLT